MKNYTIIKHNKNYWHTWNSYLQDINNELESFVNYQYITNPRWIVINNPPSDLQISAADEDKYKLLHQGVLNSDGFTTFKTKTGFITISAASPAIYNFSTLNDKTRFIYDNSSLNQGRNIFFYLPKCYSRWETTVNSLSIISSSASVTLKNETNDNNFDIYQQYGSENKLPWTDEQAIMHQIYLRDTTEELICDSTFDIKRNPINNGADTEYTFTIYINNQTNSMPQIDIKTL